MGFGLTSRPGLSEDDLRELLKNMDKPIQIGDDQSGVIIHGSSGETIEGETVSVSDWIEVYGQEVHFSDSDNSV